MLIGLAPIDQAAVSLLSLSDVDQVTMDLIGLPKVDLMVVRVADYGDRHLVGVRLVGLSDIDQSAMDKWATDLSTVDLVSLFDMDVVVRSFMGVFDLNQATMVLATIELIDISDVDLSLMDLTAVNLARWESLVYLI